MAPKKAKMEQKNKKVLTPEEKKAKAEMIALKAEETHKKKEAAAKARLLELQKLEEQYSKENMRKIHEHWRRIMRAAKVEELQKEIQILSEHYDHELQCKDATVATLLQHLQEAQKQRHIAFSKHLQIIDGLIDLHYTRMKDMEEEFQVNLHSVEREFDGERAHIITSHEMQKKELNDMMHAMENEFKEAENELRQDFEASREEIKNKNTEDYNVLKLSLESSIEELERRIEKTHQGYLESTDSKTQAFKRMIEKDKTTARLIEQRMRKLIYLHESIAYRRSKISNDSREWEALNKSMRDQKDEMNKHYQNLKRKMSKLRSLEHQELKAMAKISEEVRLDLNKKLEMAERIIKLGDLNSKLELEQEKIFPFDPLHCSAFPTTPKSIVLHMPNPDNLESQTGPHSAAEHTLQLDLDDQVGLTEKPTSTTEMMHYKGDLPEGRVSSPTKDEIEHSGIHTSSYCTDESGKEVDEWNYLSKFYKRYNKVMLDKMALELQKKRLCSENTNLKAVLTKFLEGIMGSDEKIVKNIRTLLGKHNNLPKDTTSPNTISDLLARMKKP